jgi:hypothetical protein
MHLNLDVVQTILLVAYIALAMLLIPVRLTWSQVGMLSRHRSLVGRTLVANFAVVLVPCRSRRSRASQKLGEAR